MATGAGPGAGAGAASSSLPLPASSSGGSSSADEPALKLDDTVMASMRVAAAFRDPRDQALRSVDLHATELLAVVVSEGDSIRLYDIEKRQYVVAPGPHSWAASVECVGGQSTSAPDCRGHGPARHGTVAVVVDSVRACRACRAGARRSF